MNTPYSEIYEIFLDLVKKDTKFFIMNEDGTVNQLPTIERMKKLLNRAIVEIKLVRDKKDFEIDLDDKDNDNEELLFEATNIEKNIIADYMFACYIDEEFVVRINELKKIGFTDSELRYFSPANSLKEFNSAVLSMNQKNENKVKMYLRRGRLNHKYKLYDYNF